MGDSWKGSEVQMVIAPKTWVGRIMALEPVLTRGTIVAVLGVAGMLANMKFSEGTVETVVNVILAAFGLLAAIVSRPAVTPNVKVQRMLPQPFASDRTVFGDDQI